MLGHDVMYSVEFDDSELLELAKKEERVLLTKDFELYKRAIGRGIDAYYVEGKDGVRATRGSCQTVRSALKIDMDKSHCPICNTKLKPTLKRAAPRRIGEKHVHSTTTSSGNAPTADKSTGKEHTGHKSTKH